MQNHGAPASLVIAALDRERTVQQEEMLQHTRQLERNILHTIKLIEQTKQFDPKWFDKGTWLLQLGTMCLNRAITRRDHFVEKG